MLPTTYTQSTQMYFSSFYSIRVKKVVFHRQQQLQHEKKTSVKNEITKRIENYSLSENFWKKAHKNEKWPIFLISFNFFFLLEKLILIFDIKFI